MGVGKVPVRVVETGIVVILTVEDALPYPGTRVSRPRRAGQPLDTDSTRYLEDMRHVVANDDLGHLRVADVTDKLERPLRRGHQTGIAGE